MQYVINSCVTIYYLRTLLIFVNHAKYRAKTNNIPNEINMKSQGWGSNLTISIPVLFNNHVLILSSLGVSHSGFILPPQILKICLFLFSDFLYCLFVYHLIIYDATTSNSIDITMLARNPNIPIIELLILSPQKSSLRNKSNSQS